MDNNKKLKLNKRFQDIAGDTETPIYRLNDDCVRYIFSFLPIKQRIQIQRVCKRWQSISLLSWSDVKMLDTSYKYTWWRDRTEFIIYSLPILKQILNLCGSSITHIVLPNYPIASCIELLILIKRMCLSLQAIDFKCVIITPKAAKFLAENFNDLTEIKIENYWPSCENCLLQFFDNSKSLRSVDIQISEKTTGSHFSRFPESLQKIIFRGACNTNLELESLRLGFQTLKNLQSLTMSSCCLKLLYKFDSLIDALPEKTSIEELQLSYFMSGRPDSLIDIKNIVQLINLRKLVLKGDLLIHDENLISVGTHCKNLKIVHLYDSHNVLSLGWPSFTADLNLEELKISELKGVPDHCLAAMNVTSLKILKCYRCFQFSAETFVSLIQKLENLERLDVIYCGDFLYGNSYLDKLIKNVLAALETRQSGKTLELHILRRDPIYKVRKIFPVILIEEEGYDIYSE